MKSPVSSAPDSVPTLLVQGHWRSKMIPIRSPLMQRPSLWEWMDASKYGIATKSSYLDKLMKKASSSSSKTRGGNKDGSISTVEVDMAEEMGATSPTHTNYANGSYCLPDDNICRTVFVGKYVRDIESTWAQGTRGMIAPLSVNEFGHPQAFPLFLDLDFVSYGPFQPNDQAVIGLIVRTIQHAVISCWSPSKTSSNHWDRAVDSEQHPGRMVVTQTLARLKHPERFVDADADRRKQNSIYLTSSSGIPVPSTSTWWPSPTSSLSSKNTAMCNSSPACLNGHLTENASYKNGNSATITQCATVGDDGVDMSYYAWMTNSSSSSVLCASSASLQKERLETSSPIPPDVQSSPLSGTSVGVVNGSAKQCIGVAFEKLDPSLRIEQKIGARCVFPNLVVNVEMAIEIRKVVVHHLACYIGMHPSLFDQTTLCLRHANPYNSSVANQSTMESVMEFWSGVVDEKVYKGVPHTRMAMSEKKIPCPVDLARQALHISDVMCSNCRSAQLATSTKVSKKSVGECFEGHICRNELVYVLNADGSCPSRFKGLLYNESFVSHLTRNPANAWPMKSAAVYSFLDMLPPEIGDIQWLYSRSSYDSVEKVLQSHPIALPGNIVIDKLPMPIRRRPMFSKSSDLTKFIEYVLRMTMIRLPFNNSTVDSNAWIRLLHDVDAFKPPVDSIQLGGTGTGLSTSAYKRSKIVYLADRKITGQIIALIQAANIHWSSGITFEPIKSFSSTSRSKQTPLLNRMAPVLGHDTSNDVREACLSYLGPYWSMNAVGDSARWCSIINDHHSSSRVCFRIYPTHIVQTCFSVSTKRTELYSRSVERDFAGRVIDTPQCKTLPCSMCAGIIIPLPAEISKRLFIHTGTSSGKRDRNAYKLNITASPSTASSENAATTSSATPPVSIMLGTSSVVSGGSSSAPAIPLLLNPVAPSTSLPTNGTRWNLSRMPQSSIPLTLNGNSSRTPQSLAPLTLTGNLSRMPQSSIPLTLNGNGLHLPNPVPATNIITK